jgi:hypothetical protein
MEAANCINMEWLTVPMEAAKVLIKRQEAAKIPMEAAVKVWRKK